jgi:ATP-dependent DNA helicase RecG
VGPLRADMLKKELLIFTFGDLLQHIPFRHLDKSKRWSIAEINAQSDTVLVRGRLRHMEIIGKYASKRLQAALVDETGVLELTWFQGIPWVQKRLQEGEQYVVFGKVSFFMGKPQIVHPEIEPLSLANETATGWEPIYSSTEKLKAKGLNGRAIGKLTAVLIQQLKPDDLPENLPESILKTRKMPSRYAAYKTVHFPSSMEDYARSLDRLKFEELFFAQLRLALIRGKRQRYSKGFVFDRVGNYFHEFYDRYLPFPLTNAQKRVIKEIRQDTARGVQMNRLLQGDVGSGKTIVALLAMLIAADNGFQSCLMAPTEILAQQHYANIRRLLAEMHLNIRLLTGSTKKSERTELLEGLKKGEVHFLVGTHALIEAPVQFHKLGLAIIDEQHRFGVAQRAKLKEKNEIPPHILVMTATPIPRTMAMTAYGDLDCSVMDELPPGRKPVTTVYRRDIARPGVMDFVKKEIAKGRQAYFIYPLIEESAKVDYENLIKGYDEVKAFFPEPKYYISMVHGRQTTEAKETNMQRFKSGETQIMVATTVIEVGVDVPNASVMVIESADRFGLSQLHQLRGRVGRGAEQSYCVLLSGNQVSKESRERLHTMCATNDGFLIAEKDLELRGPGDIEGTRQSGALNFKFADIVQDKTLLNETASLASQIVEQDFDLSDPKHKQIRNFLNLYKGNTEWGRVA